MAGSLLTKDEEGDLRKRSSDRVDMVNSKLGLEEVARGEDGERVRGVCAIITNAPFDWTSGTT